MKFCFFFAIFANSFVYKLHFNVIENVTHQRSFGFVANGTFEVNIYDTNLTKIKIYMPNKDEERLLDSHSLQLSCDDDSLVISNLNYSSQDLLFSHKWSGIIPKSGVYYTHVVNCQKQRTSFSINAHFHNPSSYLDSRNEILPIIYIFFALAYFCTFVIWIINGLRHTSFRIPIHTVFCILPSLKILSLCLNANIWMNKRYMEQLPMWKEFIVHILDFINYSFLLSVITYVCAGICIFRDRFHVLDHIEIILSSALITICLILFPLINSISEAFFVIAITCFGFFWHLKLNVISFIISSRILEQLKNQQIVISKIRLSQRFVMSSIICLLSTIFCYSFSCIFEYSPPIPIIILEFGLLIENILNLRFFLFRKIYAGEANYPNKNLRMKKITNIRTLVSPIDSAIVVLERNEYY